MAEGGNGLGRNNGREHEKNVSRMSVSSLLNERTCVELYIGLITLDRTSARFAFEYFARVRVSLASRVVSDFYA